MEALAERYPDRLTEVRGLGLMLALETQSDVLGFELTQQCFRHGLLAIFAFNQPVHTPGDAPAHDRARGNRRAAGAPRRRRRGAIAAGAEISGALGAISIAIAIALPHGRERREFAPDTLAWDDYGSVGTGTARYSSRAER